MGGWEEGGKYSAQISTGRKWKWFERVGLDLVNASLWTSREEILKVWEEVWECVTYLHRSCRRDKGTSTHFLSRWRIPRTRARNQTSLSSCPCRVSPPLSFGLNGVPCDPAPRRGLLVWPLLGSSSPLCSAQSFPWCGVDQPGQGAARYSVETSLPLCCLVINWTVLGGVDTDWADRLQTNECPVQSRDLKDFFEGTGILWTCTKPLSQWRWWRLN